ncbi:hypothetical protein H2199_007532 [Coniosporium tulheliwenetii]|uniref:Uncharacterized protein n=1 Tax=Coniosporium tulheliwenetii TaxID=3383036 RepID=A0ACC2YQE1_9PEZI|nr:hypothetical protein H2199_007532 [Cladosporium sp. JES 115]
MPPIPIYKDAPINPSTTAAKAEGITPRTATTEDQQQQQQPRPTPTITTATATDPTGPPPPQPGARPAAPTASSTAHNGPPLPQPGAVPKPPGHTPTVTATITETHPASTKQRRADTFDSCCDPPTTDSSAAAHDAAPRARCPSSPSVVSSVHGGDTAALPFEPGQQHPQAEVGTAHGHRPRHSLEHPPNYAQNPYIDGSAAQRNALLDAAEAERRERNSVGAWVGVVGEKLREAEEGVWRVVNGGK